MSEEETETPVGPVQGIKDEIARKQTFAEADTPIGMELVGWMLDGWVTSYTLLDVNARPVYAFVEHETKKEIRRGDSN